MDSSTKSAGRCGTFKGCPPCALLISLAALTGCPSTRSESSAPFLYRHDNRNDAVTTTEPTSLNPKVRVETNKGSFVLELNAERAPITVLNFLRYVEEGFYDGTTFHRVVTNSMLQGGGYTPGMDEKKEGLHPPIKCEWGNGLVNRRQTVGMVRQPGFANSATTQFFINLGDNFELEVPRDGIGYAVFGRIGDGWETVEAIARVELGTHPNYAAGKSAVVPKEPVVIKSMRVISPIDRPKAEALAKVSAMSESELRDALIAKYENQIGQKMVTTPSGLGYLDMKLGSGASPTLDDSVEVRYRGMLLSGREFEASGDEAKTFELTRVIEGWQEGLQSMREGGKRVLFIPPPLGFGSGGVPGKIPGDTAIVFEIELFVVKTPEQVQKEVLP